MAATPLAAGPPKPFSPEDEQALHRLAHEPHFSGGTVLSSAGFHHHQHQAPPGFQHHAPPGFQHHAPPGFSFSPHAPHDPHLAAAPGFHGQLPPGFVACGAPAGPAGAHPPPGMSAVTPMQMVPGSACATPVFHLPLFSPGPGMELCTPMGVVAPGVHVPFHDPHNYHQQHVQLAAAPPLVPVVAVTSSPSPGKSAKKAVASYAAMPCASPGKAALFYEQTGTKNEEAAAAPSSATGISWRAAPRASANNLDAFCTVKNSGNAMMLQPGSGSGSGSNRTSTRSRGQTNQNQMQMQNAYSQGYSTRRGSTYAPGLGNQGQSSEVTGSAPPVQLHDYHATKPHQNDEYSHSEDWSHWGTTSHDQEQNGGSSSLKQGSRYDHGEQCSSWSGGHNDDSWSWRSEARASKKRGERKREDSATTARTRPGDRVASPPGIPVRPGPTNETSETVETEAENKGANTGRTNDGSETVASSAKLPPNGRYSLQKPMPRNLRTGKARYVCCFFIDIDPEDDFVVVKRILGRHGQNMRKVALECDAKVRLRGRGSGFLEGPQKLESEDQLQLHVSCQEHYEKYRFAIEMITRLLEDIYGHYRRHCRQQQREPPAGLRVRMEEMRRDDLRFNLLPVAAGGGSSSSSSSSSSLLSKGHGCSASSSSGPSSHPPSVLPSTQPSKDIGAGTAATTVACVVPAGGERDEPPVRVAVDRDGPQLAQPAGAQSADGPPTACAITPRRCASSSPWKPRKRTSAASSSAGAKQFLTEFQ